MGGNIGQSADWEDRRGLEGGKWGEDSGLSTGPSLPVHSQ